MSPEVLAKILNQMYSESGYGEQVAMIHLFGIRYSEEIGACGDSPETIVKKARIPASYGTEISKGCKLARYVEVKDSVRFPSE